MLLKQNKKQPLSVNAVWAKVVQLQEASFLIGAALACVHFLVVIVSLVGLIGKFYPVPLWIETELRVVVYLLTPLIWFRVLCVAATHRLSSSRKEQYIYLVGGSVIAFILALQPSIQYSYLCFPILFIVYTVQFALDSRLPSLIPERKIHSPSHLSTPIERKNVPSHHFPTSPLDVGIWSSPADIRYAKELRTYLQPKVRQGQIKLWTPDQILPGSLWQEERARAIQSVSIAIVLISAELMDHDFAYDELPQLLSRAKAQGTIILRLYVCTCDIAGSGLEQFQPLNSPDRPLALQRRGDRAKTLNHVVSIICQKR